MSDRHQKITFKESRRLEVESFPDYIMISLDMFKEPDQWQRPFLRIDDNGLVSIIVDNGWAKYKLDPIQDADLPAICLIKVASGE